MFDNITLPKTETSMIMEPIHSNSLGNVHGGELMKIMDSVAVITAVKHCKGVAVTARVDEIQFHKPIYVGDIITCVGQLTYVGNTSMQVLVHVYTNDFKNSSQNPRMKTVVSAFFTMVHLIDDKPASVPKLKPVTKEDEVLYKLGEQKYLEIK